MVQKKRNLALIMQNSILNIIVLLHLIGLFNLLSPEMNFITELIEVVLFGYLIYHISVTHLLFGDKHKEIDILILASYFLFSIKNIISLVASSIVGLPQTSVFYDLFSSIMSNSAAIEYYGFAFGAICLLLSAAYFCFVKIGKNSLMSLIKENKRLRSWDIFIRFIVSLVVLLAFYIIVFNLLLEWIALIIHGPLIIIFFIIYLLIALNKHRFEPNKFLHNIGSSVDLIYEKAIKIFHTKKILLGISGLLVLHLLTDFFVFIIPYLTGYFLPNYLALMHAKPHTPIITLFLQDLTMTSGLGAAAVVFVYLMNIIAISVILLMPLNIWLKAFIKKKITMSKWYIALAYSSLFVFIAMPLFSINKLAQNYAGVDILTQKIANFSSIGPVLFVGLMIFFGFYLLGKNKTWHKISSTGLIFFSLIFVFIYIYNYFISISSYYLSAIYNFPDIFIKIILFIFFTINIMFYIAGFAIFTKQALINSLIKK